MTAAEKAGKQVNWRDFERNNKDVKEATHLKLPLDRIKKKRGFNPRDLTKKETVEKIALMKQSYLTGKFVPMISVSLSAGGEYVEIVDGECRFTAASQADKEMRENGLLGIQFLEVMPFKGNDKERLVMTVLGNEGENLTPLEQAEVVRRLQAMGLDRQQVADELLKSIGWIDRLIVMAKLPEAVKKQIRDGQVSPDVAVKMVKEHGEEGAQQAIDAKLAGSAKGEKVTAKHVKPAKPKTTPDEKIAMKQFTAARDLAFAVPEKLVVPKSMKDDKVYSVELTGLVIKGLLDLQKQFTE